MGSPLSPIIANLYMQHFDELARDLSPLNPRMQLCFADDTFVVWQHGEIPLVDEFLDSQHT